MKISIFTEVRVYLYKKKYYADASFKRVVERYQDKFQILYLFTRVIETNSVPQGHVEISSKVNYINIGSLKYFLRKGLNKEGLELFKNSDLIIMRLPSIISVRVYKYIKKYHKKYMSEVVGNAFNSYWNHGVYGKLIAFPLNLYIKKIVKRSNYAIYVTEKYLQKVYPCNGYTSYASNVNIKETTNIKKYRKLGSTINIFTAGAVGGKYKGQQYIIKAISKLKKENITINYYLAGKGKPTYLSKVAKRFGVSENVHFLGMLNREEVFDTMRNMDLYVLPSPQEGLPRSVIEAMSIGLVCLGTDVAGIPELLDDKCLFKRKSVHSFIKCFKGVLKEDLTKISKRNINESKKYDSKLLDQRRNSFYGYMIEDILNK